MSEDVKMGLIVAFTILGILGMLCGMVVSCDRADKARDIRMLEAGFVWQTQAGKTGFVPITTGTLTAARGGTAE